MAAVESLGTPDFVRASHPRNDKARTMKPASATLRLCNSFADLIRLALFCFLVDRQIRFGSQATTSNACRPQDNRFQACTPPNSSTGFRPILEVQATRASSRTLRPGTGWGWRPSHTSIRVRAVYHDYIPNQSAGAAGNLLGALHPQSQYYANHPGGEATPVRLRTAAAPICNWPCAIRACLRLTEGGGRTKLT